MRNWCDSTVMPNVWPALHYMRWRQRVVLEMVSESGWRWRLRWRWRWRVALEMVLESGWIEKKRLLPSPTIQVDSFATVAPTDSLVRI